MVIQLASPVQSARAENGIDALPVPSATISRSAMDAFLDRLTIVEAGGRETAKNPRSSALGPFQFITATFLEITNRFFSSEVSGLPSSSILALRTNRAFSRRAAEAYTRDAAAILAARNIPSTPANLRLAYLLGAGAAVRVLTAPPTTSVVSMLGTSVVRANPFMRGMTAEGLANWSVRNMAGRSAPAATPVIENGANGVMPVASSVGASQTVMADAGNVALPAVAKGRIDTSKKSRSTQVVQASKPKCNAGLASCRRFIALNQRAKPRPVVAAKQQRKTLAARSDRKIIASRALPARPKVVQAKPRGRTSA